MNQGISGVKAEFKDFARRLTNVRDDIDRKVKELVEFTISEIELEAIRNAPGPGDRIYVRGGKTISQEAVRGERNWVPISQAIGSLTDSTGYMGTVFIESSAGEIAAYVEFGTGQDASSYLVGLPKEWQDMARQFYINGRGGIIHKPYFYPAFIKHEVEFIKEMKEILSNITI